MIKYVSILRGINVSGQKIIKMDALKKMYENLGFQNIQTYVQSGNAIFSTNCTNIKELEKTISSQIEIEFGYKVPAIVLSTTKLETIISNNPFTKDYHQDTSAIYITFLAETPTSIDQESIMQKKHPNEEISFTTHAVYLYCPIGYGKTKLNNNFLESKLKVQATTRNWKTTTELLKLAVK